MNATFTILTAVITFIAGQVIMKFFIEPIVDYKKSVTALDKLLTVYASGGLDEPHKLDELRQASASLNSSYSAIPLIRINSKIFSLPTSGEIDDARDSMRLIYRMNDPQYSDDDISIYNCVIAARKALGLRVGRN